MRILIAAEIFPPDIGGPATYSKRLAEALNARGWDVELVCYSDEKHADDPTYVHRVIRNSFKPLHYYNYYRTLKRLARNCDVIYAQGPVGSGRPALRVAKILKKKLVVKVVGDYAWERARNTGVTDISIDDFQNKTFGGKIGMLQKVEREVCRGADRVIVPSRYLGKIVEGWGVESNKIKGIYNAFILPAMKENFSVNKKRIVSVGRLVPWKGFDVVIDVVNELNREGENFELCIIGDGPEFQRLERLIDGNTIKIIKGMPRSELLNFMAESGMLVLNTGYEGLSHVILEAMAIGLPVIATNVGGNPELIEIRVNGILVEYNNKEQLKNAIRLLDSDDVLRQKFIEISKEKYRSLFTGDVMIENVASVLESVRVSP